MRVTARGSLRMTHLIFAAVLLVRLVCLARLSGSPFLVPSGGDMYFYDQWARRILQGQFTDHQAFYGLPLYAFLLALSYRLFGITPFPLALLQICCDAGTSVLLYKIAVRAFNDSEDGRSSPPTMGRGQIIGLLAAAAWAFFSPAQAYSITLMPTALAVFAYWLLVWFSVKTRAAPRLWVWFGYGLVIGVSAMGVATILFVTPLLLIAAWHQNREGNRHARLRRQALALTLLVSGIIAGSSPCWMHNLFIARDPVLLSAHSGVNFWIGNNPQANGYPHFPGMRADQSSVLRDSIDLAESASGRPLKRSAVSKYWSERARTYITENFLAWLQLIALKVRNFWNAFEYDDVGIIVKLREHGVVLPGLRFGVIAALALPGICFTLRPFPRSRWIAGAVALAMLAVLPVFVTERYRLFVAPGLVLYAAAFAWSLYETIARRRFAQFATQGASLAVAAAFVSWPQRDPALWALEPYNSGSQALELNDLTTARAKLTRAYSYAPESAEVNFALGNLAHAERNDQLATAYYLVALRLDPTHARALNNLGVIALDRQDWRTAGHYFIRSIAKDPENAKSHYLLAKALLGAGDAAKAQNEIATALKITPAQPEFIELQNQILAAASERRP